MTEPAIKGGWIVSSGGNEWPGWDEMRPTGDGWFFGTPKVYVTRTGFGVVQVEWKHTPKSKAGPKHGVLHRWYYKTREAAERKVEREKASHA